MRERNVFKGSTVEVVLLFFILSYPKDIPIRITKHSPNNSPV